MGETVARPRSLYVHVPFCVRRCAYCDFAVTATAEAPAAEWLDAITREWRLQAEAYGWDAPLELDTLYVGGGTPSHLPAGAMALLADRLRSHAAWNAEHVEWTCEANPESFSARIAEGWRAAGVNRVSIGAQTFHEPALRWMGRLHGVEGPAAALHAARAAGFASASLDLIFALPERLGRDWAADLDAALALEPEHVSLYGLTAEAGAPLGRWVAEKREALPAESRYADEYLLAAERLTAAGYRHYEVSNFARPGHESRHNLAYWAGVPYAALGPGSHAFHPPVRRWNVRDWAAYARTVAAGALPIEEEEVVDRDARRLEHVWLSLRTDLGLATAGLSTPERRVASGWERAGWASVGERLHLTAEGWLRLDRLAVDLSAAGEGASSPA